MAWIPDHFYMTGFAGLLYVVIYAPLALGVSWLLYRFLFLRLLWEKAGVAMGVLVAALLVLAPLMEVYVISVKAKSLCREQGGMKIYRRVNADGFLGTNQIVFWNRQGFKYVEMEDKLAQPQPARWRYRLDGGEIKEERVDFLLSRYSKITTDEVIVGQYFSRYAYQIVDLVDNSILGELVLIRIPPGYLDKETAGLFGPIGWICGNERLEGDKKFLSTNDLILETIKPIFEVEN